MEADRKLSEKIYFITNENLENYNPSFPNLEKLIEKFYFIKILGITSFWEEFDEGIKIEYEKCMEDVLIGLFSQKLVVTYLILSDGKKINIYLGINDQNHEILINEMKASFPGTKIAEVMNVEKSAIKQNLNNFSHCAQIIGTPTNKIKNNEGTTKIQIEGLIRGLYGEKWAYVVVAEPLSSTNISLVFNRLAEEIHNVHINFILKGSIDEENRMAKHYIELLEAKLNKFKIGKIKGAWNVTAYIFTQDPHFLNRSISIAVSTFMGDQSLPDRIKAYGCTQAYENTKNLDNHLNTEELSIFTQIPREEFPGFAVKGYSKFGVDSSDQIKDPVYIGEIIDRGIFTGNYFSMNLRDFSKHGLIAGVTGSGKTNSCFHILSQIWGKYKIPFLVIESAKSEYRGLVNNAEFKDSYIFTLGDDTTAPFRLNPFEVSEGVLIQSHIDYLKSLFNASFVLYAPMPYILEQSIHEIYEDKGWDLSVNKNNRGTNNIRAYPILTDLYNKIEEVVDRLGYDERISMDVKAGLRARINNLRIGGKGLMLNTRRSISETDLFEKPIILELKQFVNDEEKAFVIGLILIRLYEYYESQNRTGKNVHFGDFRHLTLIEEAHRLLKNVSTESGGEDNANPKGKAVETFTNILSEIRAYGEGILIAEQIPVKLTPDAIKNTNLKIVQRMVAKDDREVLGETMNLNEKQKKFITTLEVGEAIAYAEGLHKSILIKIPNYKLQMPSGGTSDQVVSKLMQRYYSSNPNILIRFENCITCSERRKNCEKIFNEVGKIVSQKPFKEAFSKLLISFIYNKELSITSYMELLFMIRQLSNVATKKDELSLIYCALTFYAESSFESRGNFYKWEYQKVEKLIESFNNIIQQLVPEYEIRKTEELESFIKPYIMKLAEEYALYCPKECLPYISCKLCLNKCMSQYEVKTLLKEYYFLSEQFDTSSENKIEDIADVCLRAGKIIVMSENKRALEQISFCFASHKLADIGLTMGNQEKVSTDIYSIINMKLNC